MTQTAQPLHERIVTAIAGTLTSAELATLLDEARTADHQAEADIAVANTRALDPATAAVDVIGARKQVEEGKFNRERLGAAITHLEDLRREAERREKQEAHNARMQGITQRRDAMVTELREKYPSLVNELADLLARLSIVDAEATGVGLATAEQTARHGLIAANQPTTPLARCRLVDFERKYDAFIWADVAQNYRGRTAYALPADAPSQAPVTKPRQIDVPTLRVEVENRTRGQRMWFANAGNGTVWVNPGCTETAVILESALAKLRENFTVNVLGAGEPARQAA